MDTGAPEGLKTLVGTNPQINKITGNPQCQMKNEKKDPTKLAK